MTRIEHWQRISALFDAAMERPSCEREAYVRAEAGDDETITAVLRLVIAAERETGFMATSAGSAADTPGLSPGDRLGAWQVDSLIGQGGMGEVYAVHRADGLYEQDAALKLIRSADANAWARFSRERQVLARLEHPAIARLIDGGVSADGRPFMVTERVDGVTLTEHVAAHQTGRAGRIALIRAVGEAVAHAHARLVLHRDIKPSNVLVTRGGQVKLIDFGVAGLLAEGDADLAAPLTLAYAAPEQLRGEPVSTATDVFALAMLAHELLTGRLPGRRSDGTGVGVDAALPADLSAILHKALSALQDARYGSADALCDDLGNWLDRRPVEARAGGRAYRAGLFLKRYRGLSTVTALLVLALAGGLIGTGQMAERAAAEAARARLAQADAELAAGRAVFNQRISAAYSEALNRLFAGDSADGDVVDPQIVRNSLMKTAVRALDSLGGDPQRASFTVLAIGQALIFRNDFTAGIEVLEPFIADGRGDAEARFHARALLGRAYATVGRMDEAIPMLRETLAAYASGPDENSVDHAAIASILAYATGEDADSRHAIDILKRAIALKSGDPDTNIQDMIFLYNDLAANHVDVGDYDGALEAIRDSIKVVESSPLQAVTNVDTSRLNLARLLVFHAGRNDEAEALVDKVLAVAGAEKGPSREQARALIIKAEIALERGDLAGALAAAEACEAPALAFGGTQALEYVQAQVVKVQIAALRGRPDEAEALLEAARARLDPENGLYGRALIAVGVAEASLMRARGETGEAADASEGSLYARYKRRQLERLFAR